MKEKTNYHNNQREHCNLELMEYDIQINDEGQLHEH